MPAEAVVFLALYVTLVVVGTLTRAGRSPPLAAKSPRLGPGLWPRSTGVVPADRFPLPGALARWPDRMLLRLNYLDREQTDVTLREDVRSDGSVWVPELWDLYVNRFHFDGGADPPERP